jgi:hypothetical protein
MLFHVDARIVEGADIQPHVAEEVEAVAALRHEGFIEELLRREDGTGAYLVVKDDSIESAQQRMDALPFPKLGLMTMHLEHVERL